MKQECGVVMNQVLLLSQNMRRLELLKMYKKHPTRDGYKALCVGTSAEKKLA